LQIYSEASTQQIVNCKIQQEGTSVTAVICSKVHINWQRGFNLNSVEIACSE